MCTFISTKDLSREEWLQLRKNGIGGSDAGAVCGVNPYTSPMKVYYDKTSDEISQLDNEPMRLGRDLEDYVAQRFTEVTGKKVRRSNRMYFHPEYPFLLADVDRLICGEDAGLECKTASPFQAAAWEDGKIPPHYLIQCFHYMVVTGKRIWYLAVLILGQGFQYRKIEWDEAFASIILSVELDFWENYVLKRRLPAPDGSKCCDAILEQYFPAVRNEEPLPLTEEMERKLDRRMEIDEMMDLLETEKKTIDQEVKVFMKGCEKAGSEHYRVSWQRVKTRRLDSGRMKEEEPELYKKYQKESISSRFQVKAA